MSAKFCLFCGDRREGKSKEHVLPQWIIELTGEPTRIGNFGLDLSDGVETVAPRAVDLMINWARMGLLNSNVYVTVSRMS